LSVHLIRVRCNRMPEALDHKSASLRSQLRDLVALIRRHSSRNLLVVSASTLSGVGGSFLRGIILAHLLTPREFGLSVILITITALLDIFADAGLDKFVIQTRYGFRDDVLRTSHYFRVVGSLLVAAAIVILSYPLSLLFHAPSMFPAIASTGGVVALRGFVNLRYKLQQRSHRFGSEARLEVSRSAAELLVLLTCVLMFHSYWAVIAGAYANAAVQVLLSHMGQQTSYGFAPRKRLISLVGAFSRPIYTNAVIAFVAIQGDRLVVASLFTKSDLAFYTVACSIGQGLTVLLTRIAGTILLPRMTSRAMTLEQRRKQISTLCLTMIAVSTVFLAAMAIFGPFATLLVYGARYHGLIAVIFASSIVNMVQVEQSCASTLLIANARTVSLPIITLMRASALPIAILATKLGAPLSAVPLAFAVGTTLSLAVNYYVLVPLKLVDSRVIAISFIRTALLLMVGVALAMAFPVGGRT
jgi:O-antigen/teichoic acid export membrane protein